MRVKRLELVGFKSFPTKTTITFEPGVTAIVGPNGSGKTNLVDAVRWVLGEHNPRDVRAPRLEDVIFNGTDTNAPLSMAEVSLTIDNESGKLPISFTEVTITRRVYRSGESECLINQAPCRLRDIQELFLGTGLGGGTYAIIEQGHIDMVLSSKPEERRVVFEEASGVAKYLSKKHETQRRLDEVEQHLTRLADIIQEVRRQVSALERQANKARQYKTQWEQLRAWEVRLAVDELRKGEGPHQDLQQALATLTAQRQTLEQQRQEHLTSLESWNATISNTQATMQGLRTRLLEVTSQIEQHESQHTLKSRWIDELTQQRQRLAQETAQLEERATQLTEQLARLTEQRTTLDAQHHDLEGQRQRLAEELGTLDQRLTEFLSTLEALKGHLFEVASEASRQRNALADVSLRAQTIAGQLVRIRDQRGTVEQRLQAARERHQQLEQERAALAEQAEAIQRQLTSTKHATSQAQNAHHELMGRVNQLREQVFSLQGKVQLLEEVWRRYEGFPDAVKTVLTDPPKGVRGLLADLLDAKPGYEQALEAALGPLTAAIVVEDRHALQRCQELLACHGVEGAQFVVLSDCPRVLNSLTLPAREGIVGSLSQFVRCDPSYRRLVEWLLGSWGVVDEISRLWREPALPDDCWVSRAGDRWDRQSWQLVGTRSGTPNRVGRRQRWERTREELATLERELASLQAACQQAESQWHSCAAQEESARHHAEQLAPSLSKVDAQLGVTKHEIKRFEEEHKTLELDQEDLSSQQREQAEAQDEAHAAVAEAEARHRELERSLKDAQAQSTQTTQRKQQGLVTIAHLEASIRSLTERQGEFQVRIEDLQAQQRQTTAQLQRKHTEAQELAGKLSDFLAQVETHQTHITSLTEQHRQVQQEVDAVAPTLQEQERSRDQALPHLLAVEQELLALTRRLQEQESQLAERSFRRTRILERLHEVYHIDEAQLAAEPPPDTPLTDEARQTLMEQINRLKTKLEGMGPVSLGSVEEYDELKQRLEFLTTQQQDLLKAREDLRDSIHQINRLARSQFRETFAKIQQEFQRYFTQLFQGGQADVILLDPDDVLESGIEIMARPPGKRPQSISLLSGGERALIATALLFALFKVHPSPFCILDEIDAPLDEANIDRFTKVLEEFLSLSQFILITHNKKTITKADCLYGVTMEQAGISKIVSVKFTPPHSQRRPALATVTG